MELVVYQRGAFWKCHVGCKIYLEWKYANCPPKKQIYNFQWSTLLLFFHHNLATFNPIVLIFLHSNQNLFLQPQIHRRNSSVIKSHYFTKNFDPKITNRTTESCDIANWNSDLMNMQISSFDQIYSVQVGQQLKIKILNEINMI